MITIDTLVEAKKQDIIDNVLPSQLNSDPVIGLQLKEDMISAVTPDSIKEADPNWESTLETLNSMNITESDYLKCCSGEINFSDLTTPPPAKLKIYYRKNMSPSFIEYKSGDTIEIQKESDNYTIKLVLDGQVVPTYTMVGIRWRDYPEKQAVQDVPEFDFDYIDTFISDLNSKSSPTPRDFKSMEAGNYRLMFTLKPAMYSNVKVVGYVLFDVKSKDQEQQQQQSKGGGCCGKKAAEPDDKTPSTQTTMNTPCGGTGGGGCGAQSTTFGIGVNSCYLYNVLVTMWKLFVGGKIIGSCDSGTWIAPAISSTVTSEDAIKGMILASLTAAQGQSGPM